MKKPTRFRARKLSFQPLEARDLMAGDVTVFQVGGNLYVQGDSLDNDFAVEVGSSGGEWNVHPDGGTTINGRQGDFAVKGITGTVDIRLGPGNDHLTVHGMWTQGRISGDLRINAGDGNDSVDLQSVKVAGLLDINTGRSTEGDKVYCDWDVQCTNANVQMSRGNDFFGGGGLEVSRLLKLRTFDGNDQVILGKIAAIDMALGDGDDSVGFGIGGSVSRGSISLGAGNDSLYLFSGSWVKRTTIDGGAGRDLVWKDSSDSFQGGVVVKNVEVM